AAIYLAIVAPWFAIAEWRNPGFLSFFFIHEHLMRFLESTEHGWGMWFFVPIVIGGAWPWLWFLPLGIRELYRESKPSPGGSQTYRSDLRLLLTWFVMVFVFFSVPRSKLGTYILPAMPPIAIVAGFALARLMDLDSGRRRAIRRTFAIVNAALIA